jgi:hypothetical protein
MLRYGPATAKIASTVRQATFIFAVLTAAALAQQPVPVQLDYKCADDDIQLFGLTCTSEEPCPVYLELTSLEPLGAKLFLTGNFHTPQVTMDSILLMSADSGRTWTEPHPRLRSASLEQVQFVDLEKGWAGGEMVQSLPRDPFFLITADGGKTWEKRPIFEEDRVASIVQFSFESPTVASLVIQAGPKYELYETRTAGSTWTVREINLSRGKTRRREMACSGQFPDPYRRLQACGHNAGSAVRRGCAAEAGRNRFRRPCGRLAEAAAQAAVTQETRRAALT